MIYILLPLLVIVWGTIVYKIFWYKQVNDSVRSSDYSILIPSDSAYIDSSANKLILKYRDPFLEGYRSFYPYSSAVVPQIFGDNGQNLNQRKVVEKEVVWPEITYNGMVKNIKSQKRIALLVIKGKNYLLASGESSEEVNVGKISPDSVELHFKGKTMILIKSK